MRLLLRKNERVCWIPIADYLYDKIAKKEICEKYIASGSGETNSSDESGS